MANPWTAVVGSDPPILQSGGQRVAVILSNGVEKFVQFYVTTSPVDLCRQVLATIANLTPVLADPLAKIAPGTAIDTTPIVPPDPVPPTQAEQDRATFRTLALAWVRARAALSFGGSQKDVDDALTAAQAAFKPGYEDLIPLGGLP